VRFSSAPRGDRIAPGGQSLFEEHGKLLLVFHESDNALWHGAPDKGGLSAFNLQIREMTFDPDGWPQPGVPTMPTPNENTRTRPFGRPK
jgi:hypothetical protein